jgi:hypothetical protein
MHVPASGTFFFLCFFIQLKLIHWESALVVAPVERNALERLLREGGIGPRLGASSIARTRCSKRGNAVVRMEVMSAMMSAFAARQRQSASERSRRSGEAVLNSEASTERGVLKEREAGWEATWLGILEEEE